MSELISADRAHQLVAEITASVDEISTRLVELYDGRAWETLGYASWAELCEVELGSMAVGKLLPREQKRELVRELANQGLSTRAIGSALGMPQSTVQDDRAAQVTENRSPVTGLDGKTYQPRDPGLADALAQKAAELHARDEIDRGIRDTNLHTAEHVHALAGENAAVFLTEFYPHQAHHVPAGMQLTRTRCAAARDFLNHLLEKGNLP